jgi:thiamine-monophosphate kinase
MSEFELIRRIREIVATSPSGKLKQAVIGIGDDGAVLDVPADRQLVVSTDTLVEGIHFLPEVSARDLGHKSLAVNLSDLASMGAEPAWFFLNITLPGSDSNWLDEFAQGMAELAKAEGILLAGGDTTTGPLSVTITALGLVEKGRALTRAGAHTGDLVVVSGCLGTAAFSLKSIASGNQPSAQIRTALNRPVPRVSLGRGLVGLATACIDISDGLLADLGHLTGASDKGAEIELERLPYSDALKSLDVSERLRLQTAGGDDYELCFTIPGQRLSELEPLSRQSGIALTVIGKITSASEIVCTREDGSIFIPSSTGYQHFRA